MRFPWSRVDTTRTPVYVAAGHMRAGTTMLMQMLEAGGLTVDRAPAGDPARQDYELSKAQLRGGWADYDLAGSFDLPVGQRFPATHAGHAIKMPCGSARYADTLPGGYVVAFMHRGAAAIIASQIARWGTGSRPEDVEAAVAAECKVWGSRTDSPIRIVHLQYDEVLASPSLAVELLIRSGFPLRHPKRAAAVVDPLRATRRQLEESVV